LPRFDKRLHGFCSGNSAVVLFVELLFYNTVILGCLQSLAQRQHR
jgi:hypothetical protein